jgi:prepilin-type processing-associated H-X9-DG protein
MVLLTESARFVSLQPNWVGPYQPYYLTGPDIYEMAKGSLFGQLTEELVPEGEFGAVRHEGGCLYAFVDGHLKWLRPTQLRLPVEGYGCSNLATIELNWKGPEYGPYFSVPSENKRRN